VVLDQAANPEAAPVAPEPAADLDTVVILDFGSQYSQLITRRVREAAVYCKMLPFDAPAEKALALKPRGVILSGGPNSVYEAGAPQLPDWVIASGVPVLGICYGMQLLAHALGGRVAASQHREYGPAQIHVTAPADDRGIFTALPDELDVWMSHGDRIETLPPDFAPVAVSANSPHAAMADARRHYYGIQFHPEVAHTPRGKELLRAFLYEVCGCSASWTPTNFIESALDQIRAQVGETGRVLCGLSGGVDSSVAAALIYRAIGDRLTPVFVNNGLLREGEAETVQEVFGRNFGMPLVYADASGQFLEELAGISDPEEKRRRIGATFVRVFEAHAAGAGPFEFLAQGTLYPDVIESATPQDSRVAHKIKTHHNVGGLPADMQFKLIEPLRFLFKDEVRAVGRELGLPAEIVERQPFPGPGLAVRLLGDITAADLATLRRADAIVRHEIEAAGLGGAIWQFFAVLLPVRTVGVMGDLRTYGQVCAIRAVTSEDAMTADWARIPYDVLGRMSNRIVNEVQGINRVVYDITSKPPGTIEWE